MMGWAMLGVVALVAAIVLAVTRFPKKLWTIPATGLMLGAAGYAWQGSPTLAGHPVSAENRKGEVDPDEVSMREAMFGRFNYEWNVFMQADGMIRAGSPAYAVAAMQIAVTRAPQDAPMWVGLGLALAKHDGNQISPAAKLAFEKALKLAPTHPGPSYFYGLALVRAGQFAEARPYWAKAVELAPADISYRDDLRVRLFLLDRLIAAQAGKPMPELAPNPAPTSESEK